MARTIIGEAVTLPRRPGLSRSSFHQLFRLKESLQVLLIASAMRPSSSASSKQRKRGMKKTQKSFGGAKASLKVGDAGRDGEEFLLVDGDLHERRAFVSVLDLEGAPACDDVAHAGVRLGAIDVGVRERAAA
jgi:hypothetical protein